MDKICPGIKPVVDLLQRYGYETTDSGDGSHYEEGMKCAWVEPMVVCKLQDYHGLRESSRHILQLLRRHGFEAQVEASYSPNDDISSVVAYGSGLVKDKS
jgi:hypothetical protein